MEGINSPKGKKEFGQFLRHSSSEYLSVRPPRRSSNLAQILSSKLDASSNPALKIMELQAQKRTQLGRIVSALRKKNMIPAELYGRGLENLHLTLSKKDFTKVFKQAGENTIVNVLVDDKKYPVLINDVSYNHVSDEVESVDFYQVRMDEKIKLGVPLEFFGVSSAVKEKNGLLVKSLQELEIEALPTDIPHDIKVDISKILEIGQSIYVKDLQVPANVRVMVSGETVVATVTAKITEEQELAMQQSAGGVETLKVETEEKKAERDASKEITPADAAAVASKTAPKAGGAKDAGKEPAKGREPAKK